MPQYPNARPLGSYSLSALKHNLPEPMRLVRAVHRSGEILVALKNRYGRLKLYAMQSLRAVWGVDVPEARRLSP
jgi:ribosomal protein L13E